MGTDGKNVTRLTEGSRHKGDPDWTPDGGKIAFTAAPNFIEVTHHIAVINADGRNRERLEDGARHPSWSPDGKKIAFVSERDKNHDIFVIGAHGQGRENVTNGWGGQRPSFSPDGRRIAYMGGRNGFRHRYVIDTNGTDRKGLTHNEEHHWCPAWSPDGRKIVYYAWDGILEGKLHGTIHLMTADGRYIRQLSHDRHAWDYEPDINPLGLAVSPSSKTAAIWGRLKKVELNRR